MKLFRFVAIGFAALSLQGCWFVFIPGSLLAGEPYYCVGTGAKIGDKIKLTDGREATVRSLYGTYAKCERDYPNRYPIKADLSF